MTETTFSMGLSEDKTKRLDALFNNPYLIKEIKETRKKLSKNNVDKLNKVTEVSGGKRLPEGLVVIPSEVTVIPYVSAKDIKEGFVDFENCKKITPEIYSSIKRYNLKKEDLILTIVGACIGDVGMVFSNQQENAFSENVARIRKNTDNINVKFLYYMLNTSFCQTQIERLSVGSLQYKLSLKNCRKIEIALPEKNKEIDMDRQEEILNKIEKLECQIESKKEEAKNIIIKIENEIKKYLKLKEIPRTSKYNIYSSNLELNRIDALFNNPFRKIITDVIKEEKNEVLGRLIEIQKKGKIIPTSFYNLVELDDISEVFGEVKNIKEVPFLGSDKVVFRKGELLISKLEPQKGKIILVDDKIDGCVGSSELIPIKIISERILPEYLWIILRTPYILKQWGYEITGCSRERIGETELLETLIPLPDIPTQQKIINVVLDGYKKAKNLLKGREDLKIEAKELFLKELLSAS